VCAAAAADPGGEACSGHLGRGDCEVGEGAGHVPSNRPLPCCAVKLLHDVNILLQAAGGSRVGQAGCEQDRRNVQAARVLEMLHNRFTAAGQAKQEINEKR
jgi:hypothetical protein